MVETYRIEGVYLTAVAFSLLLALSLFLSLALPFIVISLSALLVYLYERLWGETLDFGAYCISLGVFALWSYIRW
jgi:hypothetical protein